MLTTLNLAHELNIDHGEIKRLYMALHGLTNHPAYFPNAQTGHLKHIDNYQSYKYNIEYTKGNFCWSLSHNTALIIFLMHYLSKTSKEPLDFHGILRRFDMMYKNDVMNPAFEIDENENIIRHENKINLIAKTMR